MSMFKYTILINMSTNKSGISLGVRTGGWSESLYFPTAAPNDLADFRRLQVARAGLLCDGAAIVGQRVQPVDVLGGATVTGQAFPGTAGEPTDIPQMALLFRFKGSGVQNVRPYLLRGIPDALVAEGEYRPDSRYPPLIREWAGEMFGWRFKAVDLDQPATEIETIDTAGNVVLAVPNLFTPDTLLTVLRSTDAFGRRFGGRYRVSEVTDSTNFKLAGWNPNPATKGGAVRPWVQIYPSIGPSRDIRPVRVTTRKVGSPFGRYRGKASPRR